MVIKYIIFTKLSHSFHKTITKQRYNFMAEGRRGSFGDMRMRPGKVDSM